MACLDNIVGIKGACSDTASDSGLYLDDVNVTLRELESYVTADYPNASELALGKIKFAARTVEQQVHSYFQGKYITRTVIEGTRIGFEQLNKEQVSGVAGEMRGIDMEYYGEDSYLDFFLSELSLFVNYTGDVAVQVYDLIQGKLLDTITVAAVAGERVTVYPQKKYENNRRRIRIGIFYDTEGVTSYKTTTSLTACKACEFGRHERFAGNLWARAGKISTGGAFIPENVNGAADTAGLSIVYNLTCNNRSWLCSVGNVLGLPILYRSAADLMAFALDYSDRQNSRSTLDFERLERRRQRYEEMYTDAMRSVLPNMSLPNDSRCFACYDYVRSSIILP